MPRMSSPGIGICVMTSARALPGSKPSIAVVGLACRYPDADDPPALLDLVTAGRRTFRRIPPCRMDLADYYSSNPRTPDATYSTRAALIEGWQLDRDFFGVSESAYVAADPAQWLALETAARALAAAGFAGGAGLPKDRSGVIVGNTLGGDGSRAAALRLRWPYSRRMLAEALFTAGIPADLASQVLRTAAGHYLAPFPAVSAQTLAGGKPASVAAAVGSQLGFRGGSFAVDGGGASSLVAVASACLALASGQLDIAIAGGVDVSLDPLELVGMAKAGVLATSDMRVYDENPTGFLPGEGCGMVLLMRAADARNSRLPIYAEILGWGVASADQPGDGLSAAADSQLLALRSAYLMSEIDPADVQLIEGSGTATAAGDEAELTALAKLRAGAQQSAALGSITANIGNTRAAAGAAGLIKTVLAMANGVLPPATGFQTPHPILRDSGAALRLPTAAARWPAGPRLAGVSAADPSGLSVHLVLGRLLEGRPARTGRWPGVGPRLARARVASTITTPAPALAPALATEPATEPAGAPVTGPTNASPATISPATTRPATTSPGRSRQVGAQRQAAYLLHGPDRATLSALLARVADVAPWLSDGEMGDLASQLAGPAAAAGPAKVAIVAARQEQLARLAREAITLLPRLSDGLLTVRPGIFAADNAGGRVTLLLSDQVDRSADGQFADESPRQALRRILAALRWLDALGVHATAAVGHGAGELAGLVWAGCTTAAGAQALSAARAAAVAGPPDTAVSRLSHAIDELAVEFRPPQRRLISGSTGSELAGADHVAEMLCAGSRSGLGAGPGSSARLDQAVTAGAVSASLLLETGPGRALVTVAGQLCKVPAISLDVGPDDDRHAARVAAALFAVGALTDPAPLFAGRGARPIDIWREQVFIASPCQAPTQAPAGAQAGHRQTETPAAASPQPVPAPVPTPAPAARKPAEPEHTGTRQAARAASPAADLRDAEAPVIGVAAWSRCYAEELGEPANPIPRGDG